MIKFFQNKKPLVFHEADYLIPEPSQGQEITKNANILLFSQKKSEPQGLRK